MHNFYTWGDWCQKQGVQHITTTAYHPQANGMVERLGTPLVKGGSVRQRRCSRLEGPSTVGSPRHAGCPKGGNGGLGGGGSSTAAAGGAWTAAAAQ